MQRLPALLCLFSLLVLASPAPSGAQSADKGSAGGPRTDTVIVKSEKAVLRGSASSSGEPVATLREFTPVKVLDKGDSWIKVRTTNGKEGYVEAKELNPDAFVSVKGKIANVRAGTSMKDPVLFSLKEHYPLKVIGREDDRVQVIDYEGDSGWVHENFVTTDKYVIVHKLPTINVRESPGTDSALRFKADKGYIFQVIGEEDGWIRVRCADGDEGWCSAKIVWGYIDE